MALCRQYLFPIAAILLLHFLPLFANAQTAPSNADPFDISSTVATVEQLGVPTLTEVDSLESNARTLFNDGYCNEALPVLEEYAKKCNWLANLISAGLDPYYGASYDDRKNYPYGKITQLIPYEKLANSLKRKRNIAIAMQGECLVKVGKPEEAVSYLLKALDLFGIDNEIWWERTRNNLYNVIGVK